MDPLLRRVAAVTGATHVERAERLQALWSGYGELFRVRLRGARAPTAIVKWVAPPARPREARSHARKWRSYEVEAAWYRTLAARCDDGCRVPSLLGEDAPADDRLLVLEDLDAAGYDRRRSDRAATRAEIHACLGWLAAFHARFLGVAPEGLWPVGTYWHLATRPDELAALDDDALREAAPLLDARLSQCTFQTIVHGDAKVANFCFRSDDPSRVAAVDFQYVGGGCGVKDVAYLLCGRFGDASEAIEAECLDVYFAALCAPSDLEREWRALYPIACADFYRFLAGWSNAEWARDRHGQRLVARVLRSL